MGCILSAASCNSWWSDQILRTSNYVAEQAGLDEFLGKNDVFFLPYLMGGSAARTTTSRRAGRSSACARHHERIAAD